MVVKGLNHDLDASFLVLKPSACQNIRSAQCIIGPKVTFAAQWPVHTMQGHSIRSAHILFLAVPTFNVSIAFYTLWEDAGQQS